MGSFWRPLNLSQNIVNSPPLLVKYEFGPSNYTVFVTDLTYIWTEHLDRKEILRRALTLDPSIDPSEDADQMQQFLRNVRSSLAGTKGTTLSLSRGGTPKQLVLSICAPLPAPLEPLEWPISLTPAAQNLFTSEFVLPCLSQQLNAKTQVNSLLQNLRDKDHVIDRLTQKMQSDGSDFSKVFPGVAVSKAANRFDSREYCAKLVKGLGEFDAKQWRTAIATQSSNLSDICLGIFAPGTTDTLDVTFKASDITTWWDRLGDEGNLRETYAPQNVDVRPASWQDVLVSEDDFDFDNEFQKQSTPLDLKTSLDACQKSSMVNIEEEARARTPSPKPADGDSTTDDGDKEPVSVKVGSKSPKKDSVIVKDAGADGLARRGSSTKIKPTIELNSGHGNIMDNGLLSKNFTGKDKRQEKSLSASPDSVIDERYETHSVLRPKAKLGKIGGKRKVPDEPGESLSQPVNDDKTSKRKLLRNSSVDIESSIGRDHTTTDAERTGRAITAAKSPSSRETSQERANRKRAELKRNLEEKSRSNARKKRKF